MADNIQVLEERVSDLEKQIYGRTKALTADKTLPESSVIESLMNANVFVSSALSGRENANALINRLPELNKYLDSYFDDDDLEVGAKLEFILAMESEIKESFRLLSEMQKLMPALETDRFQDLPELSKKMSSITSNYLKVNEESVALTNEIHESFAKYNSIITSISESLIKMDASITSAEKAAMPKKQIDW